MALSRSIGSRQAVQTTTIAGETVDIPAVILADSVGAVTSTLPDGTDRSGTVGTTSITLAAANTSRRGLEIQNISGNNIGINEMDNPAVIGSPGTYTIATGATARVRTNKRVTIVASVASSPFTATEW